MASLKISSVLLLFCGVVYGIPADHYRPIYSPTPYHPTPVYSPTPYNPLPRPYKPSKPVYKPEPAYKPKPVYKPAPYHPKPVYEEEPKPYSFDYGVQDDYTGTHFGHTENSDGNAVKGSYTVALPDGRIQTVNYVADHYNGFQAEVTYHGEPVYPDYKPSYKPSYKPTPKPYTPVKPVYSPKPVYNPKPVYKPVYKPAYTPYKPAYPYH